MPTRDTGPQACAIAIIGAFALSLTAVGVKADAQSAGLLGGEVGVVYRDAADALRLTIDNNALTPGRSVQIATEDTILCCAIVKQTAAAAAGEFDPVHLDGAQAKTTYLLDPNGISADVSLGFGISRDGTPIHEPTVDLDADGTPDRFRTCASGEGLHLTIWNGEPLAGERLWHAYYYLGYDTEADCVERDYE